MSNIFNKYPKNHIKTVATIVSLVVIVVLLKFIIEPYFNKMSIKEPTIPTPSSEKVAKEDEYVDFDKFGVVYVKVDSPSFEKSNFDVNPSTSIEVYFNKEVNIDDVMSKFVLASTDDGDTVSVELSVAQVRSSDTSTYATWKWQEVWKHKVVFTPTYDLKPVTRYKVMMNAGYYDSSGEESAVATYQFEFMTADLPGLLSSNLDRSSVLRSNDAIKIFFSSPMDSTDLLEKVVVEPYLENLTFTNNDKVLVIDSTFETGSTYTLLIPHDTKDIYGRDLGEDISYTFTVQ